VKMRAAGRLDRVLLSHDAGWYHVGEPNGGTYRAHDTLFTAFIPGLRARGFTEAEIRLLIVDNPRRALTPDP
jgi:phosphotriesterase-related protein